RWKPAVTRASRAAGVPVRARRSRTTGCLDHPLRPTVRPMPDALVERDGHVLTITLNRPARMNALSGAMLVRMYDAFVAASTSDEVSCILMTGGGGTFCSGADLRGMAGDAGNEDPEVDVATRMAADPELHWKALLRTYRPTKPIICAVEGVAIAGGTEILQA